MSEWPTVYLPIAVWLYSHQCKTDRKPFEIYSTHPPGLEELDFGQLVYSLHAESRDGRRVRIKIGFALARLDWSLIFRGKRDPVPFSQENVQPC